MWMNPPIVYEETYPSNQRTIKITAIVLSILSYPMRLARRLESAKSNLLREIRSSRGLPKEIEKLQSIMPEITSAVDRLRIQLLGVSVLLREEFRHGGMKCEELLSSAVGEQKQWLIGVHNRPQSLASSSERTKVIKKAEAALLSLDNASKELAKVEENYKRFEDLFPIR
jgi:hypothetical protein